MSRLKRCVFELLELGSPKVFASWMLIKRAESILWIDSKQRGVGQWVMIPLLMLASRKLFFLQVHFFCHVLNKDFLKETQKRPSERMWRWLFEMIEASIFQLSTVNHRGQFCEHLRKRNSFTYKRRKYNGYIFKRHILTRPRSRFWGPLKPMARFGSMEVYSEDELRGMLAREISKRPWPTVGTVVSIAHDAWRPWNVIPNCQVERDEGHPKFHCRHHLLFVRC